MAISCNVHKKNSVIWMLATWCRPGIPELRRRRPYDCELEVVLGFTESSRLTLPPQLVCLKSKSQMFAIQGVSKN